MLSSSPKMLLLLPLAAPFVFGQLVLPTNLPSVSSNFILRAHATSPNNTLASRINNWELSMLGNDTCNQFGSLTKPSTPENDAVMLFVNVETKTIQSQRDGRNRTLTIEVRPDERKILKLECGEENLSQVGVGWQGYTPVLTLERDMDSQFYACDDAGNGTAHVFYRQRDSEELPRNCADINLLFECAQGPDHGIIDVAACCSQVRDGQCIVSSDDTKGFISSPGDKL